MSKSNPRKAMAALMPSPVDVGGGYAVRPMTLAMYAALERINSPLVTGVDAKDMVELIPSAYLLTHGPEEIFRGNLLELAMKWADTVPVSALRRIRDACAAQIRAAVDVIPQGDPVKKKRTAGSPTSSTGAARPTTGRSAKPSTRCRSPRSASCDGTKA